MRLSAKVFGIPSLLAAGLVGCAVSGDAVDNASTSAAIVEPTDDDLVLMYIEVIREICWSASPSLPCDGQIGVSEQFSGDGTTTAATLPDLVLEAIDAELSNVTLVDPESPSSPPFIVLGPTETPAPDVIAIRAGSICGTLCGEGKVHYFQFDGTGWAKVTADDLGLPNEIWVS